MDELIARLVADVGIDHTAAEKDVGIILDFLVKEAPTEKIKPLLTKLPGAETLLAKTASTDARTALACAREKVGGETIGEVGAASPGLAQFV
jgi:hypothetical protein